MDQALRVELEAILSPLQQEVRLLDDRGRSLLPPDIYSYYLPNDLNEQEPILLNEYWFLRVDEGAHWVLMTRDAPLAQDLLQLAARAVRVALRDLTPREDERSATLRLLKEDLSADEVADLVDTFHLPDSLPRCALLFSLPKRRENAYHALKDLVPLGDRDVLLDAGAAQAVLVKALEDGTTPEELAEFALALEETLQEETGFKLRCGIGASVERAASLRQSYLSAKQALELGPRYQPKAAVFTWEKMLLPRFLSEVGPERARYYHNLLFNHENEALFTQEMLDTINMFLEKDLNLADTARQLYIHRNTLVYRLDKVQRLCGLDLRRFEDAFVFKLLYELKKNTTTDISQAP